MSTEFEQDGLSRELVSSGNSVIASIKNVSRPIISELGVTELE
jgi:hypothetical protein